ncbi:hypothetical protein PCIT_a0539 [Pseudoalteromonas citrea]|uniref:Uncharacterized protein n=1 Tax=Pseudoalteromonas citrea TaxID=43655 RepID=A0AAD4AL28_9GAMM|nr:hypothetical protein PCIT_a0539 [Pseudoalteromonas citrea]
MYYNVPFSLFGTLGVIKYTLSLNTLKRKFDLKNQFMRR